jgi:hypothetical protein
MRLRAQLVTLTTGHQILVTAEHSASRMPNNAPLRWRSALK